MKKCSISLITGKVKIKTTMRCHLTQLRMTILQKDMITILVLPLVRSGGKGTFVHVWRERKLGQPITHGDLSKILK